MEAPKLELLMEMHAQNRSKLRQAMASSGSASGVVLLQGGEEQPRYCTDHVDLFRQESFFAYLFGVREPGFYGALDLTSGKAVLFIPRLDPEYAVWLGDIHPPSYFKERYQVDAAYYVDEMVQILQGFDPKNLLYLLYGLNTDSNKTSKPASFKGIEHFNTDLDTLHPILVECRVHKSKLELDLLRYVNNVSSAAHVAVMKAARVGMKEYHLESTFLHYVYMQGGCRYTAYTCVCATGENSSVLHYGHAAAPNDRTLLHGDMALLDMGAEYHCYCSDITCSFPITGKFTDDERVVYGAVLEAQKAVISEIRPGVSWIDMHRLAEKKILGALKDAGFLQGDEEEMMQRHLGAVFMPHGLGHFLGLDAHDPGGYPKGMERIDAPGLRSLRTVRILEEGMVITVEPGCYFIEALLIPALENCETAKFFNKEAFQRLRGSGGVRLEDNVVVTANGCENLTKCPREIRDVEEVMAGGSWAIC
ncbi:hypothetical protein O6H91_01G156700 [Diphasiastrum complanatum]|uniref:Uncharacterized protein n=1 Tax=Diphasiastrum complanatum TaxID=34168 RepID=A0ACC2EY06_DIPCM|nr:hypothetical protein O6H91_Y397900 [Diphasiastrum complanatum]KAJ7571255.1 hypothetical protein O6H91_01G156700 [Diphasiastrum complanatum]